MSYLSASENVGFSGIPQNITEASCATQYKMVAEGVSGVCPDVNHYNDSPPNDQYLSHINENFFQTKFKIDPNELYTFQDSDVIAGEITVSHTEDTYLTDNLEVKDKVFLDSPHHEEVIMTNGFVKEDAQEIVANGHHKPVTENTKAVTSKSKIEKLPKVPKVAKLSKNKDTTIKQQKTTPVEIKYIIESKSHPVVSEPSTVQGTVKNNSITNASAKPAGSAVSPQVTFLDVFKREQGVVQDSPIINATALEGVSATVPPPLQPISNPGIVQKKAPTSAKPAAISLKPRRGRGPTLHEALQRIPKNVVTVANREWHAPGYDLFDCGSLVDKTARPFRHARSDSSDEDDCMPLISESVVHTAGEEWGCEARGRRLAARRAALRRRVARSLAAAKLEPTHAAAAKLATAIKKELSTSTSARLPAHVLSHLLVSRGMTSLFTSEDRRHLRTFGWSRECIPRLPMCGLCEAPALPPAGRCAAHAAASVLPPPPPPPPPRLVDTTRPSQAEVSEKRRLEPRPPRKPARRRPPAAPRAPRPRPRPRPAVPATPAAPTAPLHPVPPPPTTTSLTQPSLPELNSTVDGTSPCKSTEETTIALSDTEFIVHELEVGEVGQVAADDILDPSVLSQIPDEAFTEFFNQAESGATFADSSELTRALEAVLDECAQRDPHKLHTSAPVSVEMSSPAPS